MPMMTPRIAGQISGGGLRRRAALQGQFDNPEMPGETESAVLPIFDILSNA